MNHLFTLARQGQRQPSTILAIAIVPVILVLLIVTQVAARQVLRPIFPDEPADLTAGIIGSICAFLCLWICLTFWIKRPFWSLGFENHRVLPRVLAGALTAGFMVAAMAGLVMIPGTSITRGELPFRIALLTLFATTAQSSAEETLFRGWLLPIIGARYKPWIGVLVSSLLFALAHTLNGPTPLGWLNLFLFGTFAAAWTLAEGGLWGACAWHAIWNWTESGLLGLIDDRSVPHPGLLVTIRPTGPDLVTGGAFGPEGGLAATAILLIGISIVTKRAHRSR
jgi:membrane protease YdiL (CAAX protease family)